MKILVLVNIFLIAFLGETTCRSVLPEPETNRTLVNFPTGPWQRIEVARNLTKSLVDKSTANRILVTFRIPGAPDSPFNPSPALPLNPHDVNNLVINGNLN